MLESVAPGMGSAKETLGTALKGLPLVARRLHLSMGFCNFTYIILQSRTSFSLVLLNSCPQDY